MPGGWDSLSGGRGEPRIKARGERMANYRRLISYIYAYEGEVKGKNIGFAKLEARNGQLKLSISVKKVYVGGSDLGVYLLAPGREIGLGRIFIRGGAGEFRTVIAMDNAADSGIGMDECYGLTIHEPSDSWRAYTTIWEDAVAHAAEVELAGVTSEGMREKEEDRIHRQAERIAAEVEREIEENGDGLGIETGEPGGVVDKVLETEALGAGSAEDAFGAGGLKEPGEGEDAVYGHLREAGERLDEGREKLEEAGEHLKEAEEAALGVGGGERIDGEETEKGAAGHGGGVEGHAGAVGNHIEASENPAETAEDSAAATPRETSGMVSPSAPGLFAAPEREGHETRPFPPAPQSPDAAPGANPPANGNTPQPGNPQGQLKSLRDQLLEQVRKNEERRRNGTREPIYSLTPKILLGPAGAPMFRRPEGDGALPERREEENGREPAGPAAPWRGRDTAPTLWPREQGDEGMEKPAGGGMAGQAAGNTPSQQGRQSINQGEGEPPAGMSRKAFAPVPGKEKAPEPAAKPAVPLPPLQPKAPVIDEAKNDLILGDPKELERLEKEEREQADPALLWEAFRKRCPKIQAFDCRGGCEILTIKPQDIGLLPRETWTYGNNSFLLHGYYNYRYLILARVEDGNTGESRYLLGVPGNYYSNEKYMASMFGFPHFVLAKRQSAPGGRFGYWYADIRLNNMNQ